MLIRVFALLLCCVPFLAHSAAITLQAGDVLYIGMPGESAFNKDFQLNDQGQVNLPEAGPVTLSGNDLQQAKDNIKSKLSLYYKDLSNLSVQLKERRLLITVLGFVKKPGKIDLPPNANVQMALAAAGGLAPGAQLNELQLRRGQQVNDFDYKKYLDTGNSHVLPTLKSGDVIFVPSSELIGNVQMDLSRGLPTTKGDTSGGIKIMGEVHKPGTYPFKQSSNIIDYIMRAGGVTRYGGINQIGVITDGEPSLFNLADYMDTGDTQLLPTLKPGSIVFVPEEQDGLSGGSHKIYIIGAVNKAGSYDDTPKGNFLDLLANAGGPSRFANLNQIRILHSDGTVTPFDLTAYTDGTAGVSLPRIEAGDTIYIPESKQERGEKSWLELSPRDAVKVMGAVSKPGRYAWSAQMSLMDLLAEAGGPTTQADLSKLEILDTRKNMRPRYFDLQHYLRYGGNINSIPQIKAGDTLIIPTLIAGGQNDKSAHLKQAAEDSIYIFGQINRPGRYAFNHKMNFLDIISAADGPTETADIRNINVIHQQSGKPEVSKVNLSLFFETGDGSIIPKIKAGDSIYIPSTNGNWLDKNKQSTVRVLGSVTRPGRYSFDDSMTILDLLAEAGGPTATALVEKIVVVNMSCCQDQARRFDLENFAKTGNTDLIPIVRAGDTVYVPDISDSHWRRFVDGVRDIITILGTVQIVTGGTI